MFKWIRKHPVVATAGAAVAGYFGWSNRYKYAIYDDSNPGSVGPLMKTVRASSTLTAAEKYYGLPVSAIGSDRFSTPSVPTNAPVLVVAV